MIYELYDSNMDLQTTSDTYHEINAYTFYGLKNKESYYVRAVGKTVFGFSLDTGYKKINVLTKTKSPNINFVAENSNGKILFSTHLVITDCKTENDDYSFDDGKVNIKNNSITYTVNNIDNFSLVVKACEIPFGKFVIVNCEKGSIKLIAFETNNKYYCKLVAQNGLDYYLLYEEITDMVTKNSSNRLEKIDVDKDLIFEASRKDGLYSLSVKYR